MESFITRRMLVMMGTSLVYKKSSLNVDCWSHFCGPHYFVMLSLETMTHYKYDAHAYLMLSHINLMTLNDSCHMDYSSIIRSNV